MPAILKTGAYLEYLEYLGHLTITRTEVLDSEVESIPRYRTIEPYLG
jgi:hypothetical protein